VTDPVERILTVRRRKFFQVREMLLDRERSTFIFVLVAERLPILETGKAVALLSKHGVPIGGLIVNRVLPEDALDHPFFAARKDQERRYLEEIDDTFPDLPRLRLPLLPHDVVGNDSLQEIVSHLGRAMGLEPASTG